MELSQLKNFAAVVEAGQLTKAARQLHIAQPNMSSSIHQLEREVGLPMFDRNGRSLILNENGRIFYESVSRSLACLNEGILEMHKRAAEQKREVTLSVLAGTRILPRLLEQVHEKVPEAHISVTRQELGVHPRMWDIAIYADRKVPQQENCFALLHQSFCLLVPEGHPLAERESVSLQEVGDEPFITFPASMSMGKLIQSYFADAGCQPNVVLETDDGFLTAQLVRSGVGLAMSTKSAVPPDGTKYVPISYPSCTRYIIAECRSDRPMVRDVLSCVTSIPYRDFAAKR